ncbi:MAG: hypothetical protein LQ339_000308 [Xanthoria mediterranea]|nr:MAG: hypothetical protein LQ339_000308 [Xanthoria mediterranea]
MAKDKDRALNPATAQLKADKARALKKGKAAITAQRTERLAQRNPARLERQIADLKASGGDAASGGRDKKQLEELEKQLGMVRKAREKVGDKGPRPGRERHALPPKPEVVPAVVPKTTYEAKPVVRDLRKEAVKAFMPAVVARKVRAVKGEGGRLLEEEEVERLEREGYLGGGGKRADGGGEEVVDAASEVGGEDVEKRRLEEEEERFRREVRMEEVRDEDL